MSAVRLPANDPRTLARDIPGFFDALFPQLVPGIVAHLNRKSIALVGLEPVSQEMISASGLQHAMLFELAVAVSEQLINGRSVNWPDALSVAWERQRRHFDARHPLDLTVPDKQIAQRVADNLYRMLLAIKADSGGGALEMSPQVPGYEWIASSVGDFAVGRTLIEVKCTNKRFSSSDYRQVVIYWLLSYFGAIEGGKAEWLRGVLVNPRLNSIVSFSFDELIRIIAADRSKAELLELFSAMIASRKNN
ncbi:MAG: hypothetical protein AB1490_30545 [Pseudomonadota bacterium]